MPTGSSAAGAAAVWATISSTATPAATRRRRRSRVEAGVPPAAGARGRRVVLIGRDRDGLGLDHRAGLVVAAQLAAGTLRLAAGRADELDPVDEPAVLLDGVDVDERAPQGNRRL